MGDASPNERGMHVLSLFIEEGKLAAWLFQAPRQIAPLRRVWPRIVVMHGRRRRLQSIRRRILRFVSHPTHPLTFYLAESNRTAEECSPSSGRRGALHERDRPPTWRPSDAPIAGL